MNLLISDELADRLRAKALSCGRGGSPLYADLLAGAARDCAARGPVFDVLAPHAGDRHGSALELRFVAALHQVVLEGRAPDLARHFPSVGGTAGPDGAWPAARRVLADQRPEVARLVGLPCQTNEVGRSAVLAIGLRAVASWWPGRPVRLLELGASAGLNLRFDALLAAGVVRDVATGDAAGVPRIVERTGCDLNPIDATTTAGRLRLISQVWADQTERVERLGRAIDVAAGIPATVDRDGAVEWLEPRLPDIRPGVVTVVWHSVLMQYLDAEATERLEKLFATARASVRAPLVRLMMEPESRPSGLAFPLVATVWPGGEKAHLADADGHGYVVRPVSANLPRGSDT